jgi:hypothetical protein
LNHPSALSDKLELDYHQKLALKFQIKDKRTGEFIRVQQAFLRFTNKKSRKEVIYLAEAATGANAQYKVEVVRLQGLFFFISLLSTDCLGLDQQRQRFPPSIGRLRTCLDCR